MLFNYQPSLGLGTPTPGVCVDLCGTIMFSDSWLRTLDFLKMQRQFWGLSIQEKQRKTSRSCCTKHPAHFEHKVQGAALLCSPEHGTTAVVWTQGEVFTTSRCYPCVHFVPLVPPLTALLCFQIKCRVLMF